LSREIKDELSHIDGICLWLAPVDAGSDFSYCIHLLPDGCDPSEKLFVSRNRFAAI
jgi:hypothetical protein